MSHRRLPSLSSLRAFEAAARHESAKQAAQELSVTATAISHQVRGLEEALGVPLFLRKPRQLELTAQGRELQQVLETADLGKYHFPSSRCRYGTGSEPPVPTLPFQQPLLHGPCSDRKIHTYGGEGLLYRKYCRKRCSYPLVHGEHGGSSYAH